ncbi:hypothetical protein AYR62_07355 [Secundilactobacillus paracollinoides]|uniref:Uncharacterized protein n=2 Tax=Secundilactobacillus paracollinoides TaxID=240427 RepID=A0A1B2J1M3_9LACO|nr:hypothetical protein AYR61_13370 [Secundilactobacillus paracollinoides]ANZ63923.1 hypothetical protein AYR62_07355 [Secundilactobacillus paracollinoides]ANZ68183.1 hypothetical protein AYR63_14245 [Secundilactobacillus paracollinoides]KRL76330.1 hypothetical protein FC17_GL001833 [Secundilactobacillus paracollinoides DSM 15502 = JCM 11969]
MYTIIVLVPCLIIGGTMVLVHDWPANSVVTILTLFVAFVVSMTLVTVIYLKLLPFVKRANGDTATDDDDHHESH